MNAYKLAGELDECMNDGSTDLYCVEKAATLLRQQADRIALYELFIAERGETGAFIVWHSREITNGNNE